MSAGGHTTAPEHPRARQHFDRVAGVAVPLFSLRGEADEGGGTILDVPAFVDWLERWQQHVLQLLPINESSPREASPYNAISVFAIDPTYISTAHLPELRDNGAARRWRATAAVASRLQALSRAPRRHRPLGYALKLHLLELAFEEFEGSGPVKRQAEFEAFCRRQAWWLDEYALFRALKDRFGWTSWEQWPEALRSRDPDALRRARTAEGHRVRFAQYLQWLAGEQWEQMRAHARQHGVLIKGDVPFVCSRDSADVWAHQELFDLSSSAGAPPDAFSASGQAWGLPLYNWTALRRSEFEWWRQRARHARELYDLFRIDHLVGLYRTYGIPIREGGRSGFIPSRQEEQLAQGRDLLQALLDEARGQAAIVAEDLGVVPPWVRESLGELGIPGYKIFRWEKTDGVYTDPRRYPVLSLATTGTHDTDTLVEWWEHLDDRERQAVQDCLERDDDGTSGNRVLSPELHLALLRRLYDAGSVLTILPIQDLFGWRERINTPGTVHRRNWSYRVPIPTAQLDAVAPLRERMQVLQEMVRRSGRAAAPSGDR